MSGKNDNRMRIFRNLDKLSKQDVKTNIVEYEIATECHISGIFDYDDGAILCGILAAEKCQDGLYHYWMKVKYASNEYPYYNAKASSKGYYFKGGVLGELLALFSLHFRCRFYLITTFRGELTNRMLKQKMEERIIYKACNPKIHPPIFSFENRNFATGLAAFLDSIKILDQRYHQQFILASYHYARSLKEIGVDSEMIFIRLVSAIEALTKYIELNRKIDSFSRRKFDDVVSGCTLSEKEKNQLEKIFEVRKSKARFLCFIDRYSKGYLRGGNYKAKHCKITRKKLPGVLNAIYDARSAYLHNGEPMYLSQPMHGGEKWDTDPSMGAIIDNRTISASKKLPHTYFFEGLVRQCLINFATTRKHSLGSDHKKVKIASRGTK